MVWWVYRQLVKAKGISDVYVATDDERIEKECRKLNINVVMTSPDHPTHLERLHEVSTKIDADFYINVNGDEPLVESSCIEDLLPKDDVDPESSYAANGMMVLDDPIEAIDSSKIKIATDMQSYALYLSRNPIPFPKARSDYELKKFVGVQCFSKKALEFCVATKRGYLEAIEDIDEFRFIENGHKLLFVMTKATTLSVDTQKDLERVNEIIRKRIDAGEIALN